MRAVRLDRLALAAVIACSLALALLWLVKVPFFGEPDENSHADYSFTIFSSGGLVRTLNRRPATNVHPMVRYLEEAGGFRAMRYSPDGRAPAGYGTRSYFRRVDAGAPDVPRDFLEHDGGRIPYVAQGYGYLYYLLDASAIALAALLGHGSATLEFLAARGLGLVLLTFSLLLSYGTLRELRYRRIPALLLTATIGLFPLTSWVSAYVQPDNLSFTAVSLVLYLSVRLRREANGLRAALWLGLALALLALTKSQYFVVAALPAILDRTLRFSVKKPSAGAWAAFACILLGPTAAAGLSSLAITYGAGHQVAAFVAANGNPIGGAARHGVGALVLYLARSATSALTAFFVSGFTFYSYWGAFGWIRTAVDFGAATDFVFDALSVGSSIVAGMVVFRTTVRIWPRLRRVGERRGGLAALRLLASDVPLNAYALFVPVMLAVSVSTRGQMGDDGRYWLPFIVPALLCATRYAPQALPRFARVPVAGALGGLLFAYSVTCAVLTPHWLEQRFYAAPSNAVADETLWHVQRFGDFDKAATDAGTATFAEGAVVPVEGVAVDSRSGLPAIGVEILVDGKPRAQARTGIERPEAADDLHDDALLSAGFAAVVDMHGLAPGSHRLRLAIRERSRPEPYLASNAINFEIARNPVRPPGLATRVGKGS